MPVWSHSLRCACPIALSTVPIFPYLQIWRIHTTVLQLGDKRTTKIWKDCCILYWCRSTRNRLRTAKHDGYPSSVHLKEVTQTNSVPLHVKWQVIWPWKAPVTVRAFEWLCTRMFSVVSCKFIWASKPPWTAFPGAFVRFFSCVSTPVSLEVRAFGVHFRAPFIIAFVGSPSFHMISFA